MYQALRPVETGEVCQQLLANSAVANVGTQGKFARGSTQLGSLHAILKNTALETVADVDFWASDGSK